MTRFHQIPPLLSGDELGWRLSGIADGEGHFGISRDSRKGTCQCVFVVGMRADDRPFLELLMGSTGVGYLIHVKPSVLTLARRPGTNPQTHWRVDRRAHCVALVELFDRYPLLSKKAWDYSVWREAVLAWQRSDQPRMAQLRSVLMEGRAYTESLAAPSPIVDPQLGIEGLA